jgi:plastocyanin
MSATGTPTSGSPPDRRHSASNTRTKSRRLTHQIVADRPQSGAHAVKLSADPSGALKFNTKTLSAKAGAVTITMNNPSSLEHGIAVERNGVDKDGKIVGQGGTSVLAVQLKAGKYTFLLPRSRPQAGGMQGTLTVT